jgi:hypothetical protein
MIPEKWSGVSSRLVQASSISEQIITETVVSQFAATDQSGWKPVHPVSLAAEALPNSAWSRLPKILTCREQSPKRLRSCSRSK